MPLVFIGLVALLFLAGCANQTMSPVGPSVSCPASLEEASHRAIAYWNSAGLRLDDPSANAPIKISIKELNPAGENSQVGTTVWHIDGQPEIFFTQLVVHYAQADDWHRSVAARTIAHEIGHALGFQHSNDPDSVMYPITGSELPSTAGTTDTKLARSLL